MGNAIRQLVRDSKTCIGDKLHCAKWAGWRKPQTETVGKRTKGVSQTAHSHDAHGKHLALFLSDSLFDDTDEFSCRLFLHSVVFLKIPFLVTCLSKLSSDVCV